MHTKHRYKFLRTIEDEEFGFKYYTFRCRVCGLHTTFRKRDFWRVKTRRFRDVPVFVGARYITTDRW